MHYGGGDAGPVWNEKTRVVTADRTSILSKSADELLMSRQLPRYDGSEEWNFFITSHPNSQRIAVYRKGAEPGQNGEEGIIEKYVWIETGSDHLFHAATYAMVARMAPVDGSDPIMGIVSTSRANEHLVTDESGASELGDAVDPENRLPSWRMPRRMG